MSDALMMKMAYRNPYGLNPDYDDSPDSEDMRREIERRKSPIKRAVKTYLGKGAIAGAALPIAGAPIGLIHAHLQNKGAKMRTRHMSDEELHDAYNKRK